MRRNKIILIVMLIGSAISISGCVVAAVGAAAVGTVVYVKGDLEIVESYKLDLVYEATLKAMEELELHVTRKMKDALSAKIDARDAQDKKITVKLKATSEEATKLFIRVGIFGDETKSRLIYQKIRENLN